jgi:hypothetical protein
MKTSLKPTSEQIAAALPHLRLAAFHRAKSQDALRDLEYAIGADLDGLEDAVADIAFSIDRDMTLEDVAKNLDAESCASIIEGCVVDEFHNEGGAK